MQGSIPQLPGKRSGAPWVLEESQELGLQPENLAMLACLVLGHWSGWLYLGKNSQRPSGRPSPASPQRLLCPPSPAAQHSVSWPFTVYPNLLIEAHFPPVPAPLPPMLCVISYNDNKEMGYHGPYHALL